MKIACAQIDCQLGDVAANREKIVRHIRSAAESGAELAIFPECALTGYSFDSLEEARPFAEPLAGPSSELIAEACRETGVYTVVGFIERDGANFFNAAMIVGPDGVVGSYRKVHLPYMGVDRFLTPGDMPFRVFDIPPGRIGVNICYDMSFPEAARTLKLLGAELIVLPTNWPPGARRNPDFVVNARAQENHVNVAAVNRVGVERGWPFIGRSKVADFNGDTLAEAGTQEQILFVEVDIQGANHNRIVHAAGSYEIDRIADRRPEFYGVIIEPARKAKTGDQF